MLYSAPQRLLTETNAAFEWYRPGAAEHATLTQAVRDHVDNGGLLPRSSGVRKRGDGHPKKM